MSKFIHVERQISGKADAVTWKLIPNGERIPLLDKSTAAPVGAAESSAIRHIFHIHHVPSITRGNRVTYFGQKFRVLDVSDSSRLLGIELLCESM